MARNTNNTATGTTSATTRSTTAQSAVIYDILSEGPIEGLVQGASSIRLNDNPVLLPQLQ